MAVAAVMGDSLMRITCPKCQCKGLIDTAPLLSKARVTCVRCGTAFDALMADGVVETALVTETPSASVLGQEAPSESYTPVEPDEVLSLPQMACEHAHQSSETTILDFAGSPQAEVEPQPGCTAAPIHNGSLQANGLDAEHNDPLADSGEFVMPEEYVPQLSREALEHHGESDKYGMGVRLMRVSPLWLLACCFGFIALVIALNGMTGAAVQVNSASSQIRPSVTGNQATNQSATSQHVSAANEIAARAERMERAQPEIQPTADAAQSKDDAQATQLVVAQPAPSATTERQPNEPALAKPAPEPQAQSPSMSETAGRFTLQVGSYNNPVEANEHAARLQRVGFAAQVVAVDLPKRGIWYRVQTGRFDDRADAARYGAQLHAKGAAENFIISEVTAH